MLLNLGNENKVDLRLIPSNPNKSRAKPALTLLLYLL